MTPTLETILAAVRQLVPDGERIADALAALDIPDRVVDALSDRPHARTIPALFDGVVGIADGDAGVLLCRAAAPGAADVALALRGSHGNPLGNCVGSDAWIVPAPDALLANVGTTIVAGAPFVRCTCTFDQLIGVFGPRGIAEALEEDLPGLQAEDARALTLVMVSWVEDYAEHAELSSGIRGTLVRAEDFEAANEPRPLAAKRVARERALGILAIGELVARGGDEPLPPLPERLGSAAQPIVAGQYIRVSNDALAGAVRAVRVSPDNVTAGWLVAGLFEDPARAVFGMYTEAELAALELSWLPALALPAGWSFQTESETLLRCTAPDGRAYEVRPQA